MTTTGAFELAPIDGSAPFGTIGPDGIGLEPSADGHCRIVGVAAAAATSATIRVDRRCLVLAVRSASPLHVNGRPVREFALLRAGDVVVVGHRGFRVRTATPPRAPQGPAPARLPGEPGPSLPRAWLRCVVGRHAGQVRALADGETLPWGCLHGECEARFSIEDGRLVVRAAGPDGLVVDGHRLAAAVLGGGEQLVVGGEHFVVDGVALEPSPRADGEAPDVAVEAVTTPGPRTGSASEEGGAGFSPWWLIAAAVVIAGALVLLFGRV